MIFQLNPAIPVITPKGKALAVILIDYGSEYDLRWTCFQDDTGECWTFANHQVRAQQNITHGREHISPFYDPDDVAFHSEDSEDECEYKKTYQELSKDYENVKERYDEVKEDVKDWKLSHLNLQDKYNELKSLIKKLLYDDHIYPNLRTNVQDKINALEKEDS